MIFINDLDVGWMHLYYPRFSQLQCCQDLAQKSQVSGSKITVFDTKTKMRISLIGVTLISITFCQRSHSNLQIDRRRLFEFSGLFIYELTRS